MPQHGLEDVGIVISAQSTSDDCTISLNRIGIKRRQGGRVMVYLYSDIMMKRRQFGRMSFVDTYEGLGVGVGFVTKVGGGVA